MTAAGVVPGRVGLVAALVTGAGFAVGGISRIPFLGPRSFSEAAWVGLALPLAVQAIIGCGALAWAFRAWYPALRMWWISVASVVLGSALLVAGGEFYLLLLPLAGLLVGVLLGLLLRLDHPGRMIVAGFGGHTLALLSAFAGSGLLYEFGARVSDTLGLDLGEAALNSVGFVLPDAVVGATLAFGVWWSMRPKRVRDWFVSRDGAAG